MKIRLLLFLTAACLLAQSSRSMLVSLKDAPNAPTDSPGAGTYGSTQSVTLSDATAQFILYTTNGSTPSCPATGTLYSGAISVTVTTTIKAVGCNGVTGGGVLTSVYTISGASFSIVHASPYVPDPVTTNQITSNQAAGNSNFAMNLFCTTGACGTNPCPATTFTDNAGSHGGSGNNTYTTDAAPGTQTDCAAIGRAFNITATTSTVTVTATAQPNYQQVFLVEVNGLGATPALRSAGVLDGSGITSVSTSGSCTTGDFAVAAWFSGATPTAGSGWTAIGTPANNSLYEWRTVASTGTLSATVTGTSGNTAGAVACYHP